MSLIENNMILIKIAKQYRRGIRTFDEAITGISQVYQEYGLLCTNEMAEDCLNYIIRTKKQSELENALDMWLTEEQIEMLRVKWNAFYCNPLKYKDTVVIDMVKQDLRKIAFIG